MLKSAVKKVKLLTENDKNEDLIEDYFLAGASTLLQATMEMPKWKSLTFLSDPSTNLSYPNVRQVFFRQNAALPSSAPVERLLSFAGQVHSCRRANFGDNLERKP